MEAFSRVKNLIGEKQFEKLQASSVAVFGVGGVGGFVAEALVRSGIGSITLFDNDKVDKTNLNRQIIATNDTIGVDKVDAIKQRLISINQNIKIKTYKVFYLPENANQFDFGEYDYIVDAVDTVSAKLEIISRAKATNKSVISSMGTAGKLEIEKLKVGDIFDTKGCPLARVMRRELKKRGIDKVKVVYSEESVCSKENTENRTPPSMIFVPATAGLMIAKEVVLDLIKG